MRALFDRLLALVPSAFSRLRPGTRRRCESFKGRENKKSRRLKGAGLGSKRFSCAAHGPRHESPDYFWMLA
jgi:hypothetical protein